MSFRNSTSFYRSFRGRLKGVAAELISDGMRVLALDALTGVVTLTPVDTGRLRGAWDVEIGEERSDAVPADAEARNPISEGAQKLAGLDQPVPVRIVNNVEYAAFVNDGTPRVAPVLMVERTAERLRRR